MSTTYAVRKGDTLDELSTRYGVSVDDLRGANPEITDPDEIRVGQSLEIPLAPAHGQLPGAYVARPGDTLTGIAARYHSNVRTLSAANNIVNPDSIRPGEDIWIPGAGGQVDPDSTVAESDLEALPPVTTPQARQVNGAVLGVQSAQEALATITRSASRGNVAAQQMLQGGALQRNLTQAKGRLQTAVSAEIDADVGAHASPAQVGTAGQGITARYAADPAAKTLVASAVTQDQAGRRAAAAEAQTKQKQAQTKQKVDAIVGAAQSKPDPIAALDALNAGYAKAPADIQRAVLADPGARKIINAAVRWANEPLTQKPPVGIFPQGQTLTAIGRLNRATQGLDKTLAGTVAGDAAPAYQAFANEPNNRGLSVMAPQAMTALMQLSARITGTPQGNSAIAQFVNTGAWDTDAVENAIGAGTDPAYAVAVVQYLKKHNEDPSMVVQTINDGIQLLQGKVDTDVKKLAQHDSELAWLTQNDGAGMTPQQLAQAVAAYRTAQGPAWQKADAALQQQVTQDGSALARRMITLHQLGLQLPSASATADKTLASILKDPSAVLSMTTAIQSDPSLTTPKTAGDLANVLTLAKIGDNGRKMLQVVAAGYVRQTVLKKLQDFNPNDPASVAQAKAAIHDLDNQPVAKLLGVSQSDLNKVIGELDKTVDNIGNTPEEAATALAAFNKTLNTDASLAKGFNKATLAGQLLRGVAVAFAGVSLYGAYKDFNSDPSDPQNDITLLVDGAGFVQKNAELLVGLGKIDKTSALGQLGGEWRPVANASVGDFLTGISAVLAGVSAVRSGFGLGVPQSTPDAIFSGLTSVGGAAAVLPAFGAAAWLGPVGLGVAAVGIVGGAVYKDVTSAHQYEGASKSFLKAAGYNDAAATALSKQGGVFSGATGAAQMPFLAKYAQFKHLTPVQLQAWVNSLTPAQVNDLGLDLLVTAGDSHGKASNFTNGKPQTAIVGITAIPLANTVGVFQSNLTRDHVPLP